MSRTLGEAVFRVRPDLRQFGSDLGRGVDGPLQRTASTSGQTAGREAGKGYGKMLLATAGGLLTGQAVLGLLRGGIDFLKDSYAEARESQKVAGLTNAVIKSTGGAANVTAASVGRLSTAISNKVGIDDEAIQSGANMLLTFRNLRNESGKGNKVFDQATRTLVDMSAALGKDPKTAAIALGKALNDPIKGITALGRVGVTFDAQQKATIATMVKQGNTAGAQKVILRELNKEFGGAAAAQTTAGEKAKVAWNNLKETVGGLFMPVLDKVFSKLSASVIPALQSFAAGLQAGTGPGGKVVSILKLVGAAAQVVGHWIGSELVPFVKQLADRFRDAMGGTAGFKQALRDMAPALTVVKAVLGFLWAALKVGINAYIPAVVRQFRLMAKVIGLLGTIVIGLWNKFLAPVLRWLLRGAGIVASTWAAMLRGLSKIPGFGWAKGAADKMKNAADKARELADGIKNIPTAKNVKVDAKLAGQAAVAAGLNTLTHDRSVTITAKLGGQAAVQAGLNQLKGGNRTVTPPKSGHKASGGLVARGRSYVVGEFGREMFTPSVDGRITPNNRLISPERSSARTAAASRGWSNRDSAAALVAMLGNLRMSVEIGGEQFDARVRGVANDEIDSRDSFASTLERTSR